MNQALRELLINTVGKELNTQGFYLVDLGYQHALVFHRKTKSYLEIVQFAKDKYETYITAISSILFINDEVENSSLSWQEKSKKTNINYPFLNEYCAGNREKASVDECCIKYTLKGNLGYKFHYGDVYLTFGQGIIGTSPKIMKKPIGLQIKKATNTTYDELCDLIIKQLPKMYSWLEKQKTIFR